MEDYDFSCYILKYDKECIQFSHIYPKDIFKNQDGMKVPLIWNYGHNDPACSIGYSVLENRQDGVYAYCTLNKDTISGISVLSLIRSGETISSGPFVGNVETDGKYVLSGIIRYVSLMLERIDDEKCYHPVLMEKRKE